MALTTTIRSGHLPYIKKGDTIAPFSSIIKRERVDSSLKTIFASERVVINSLRKSRKERGPDRQPVWNTDKLDSRIKLVGRAWTTTYNVHGMYVHTNTPGEYIEVTAFCTGINIIHFANNDNGDWTTKVDGGAFGSNILDTNWDDVLSSQNVKTLNSTPMHSGLPLAWHTFTIKLNTLIANDLNVYGFDIINDSPQMTVLPGTAYGNGYEYTLDTAQLIDHSIGFENILDINLGTKGGTSTVYIDTVDGLAKKVITLADTIALYGAASDHSNEEAYMQINSKCFGRLRTSDFTAMPTDTTESNSFVEDNNNLSLMGNNIRISGTANLYQGLFPNSTNDFFTLGFEGSGLAVTVSDANNVVDDWEVSIDGDVQIATLTINENSRQSVLDICSGLGVGHHTAKFRRKSAGGATFVLNDFIVYRPKKAQLPMGAIPSSTYCVFEDFDSSGLVGASTNDSSRVIKGAVYHNCFREWKYANGTWTQGQNTGTTHHSARQVWTSNSSATAELEFFGGDTVLSMQCDTGGVYSFEVRVDGVLDATGTNLVNCTNDGAGLYSTTSSTSNPVWLSFPINIGKHRIEVKKITAPSTMKILGAYVDSRVNFAHPIIGSRSIGDIRNFENKNANNDPKEVEYKCDANLQLNSIRYSRGIAQVFESASGQLQYFYDDYYAHRPFAYGTHTHDGIIDMLDSVMTNPVHWSFNTMKLNFLNDTGAAQNPNASPVIFKEILQKDEFEE